MAHRNFSIVHWFPELEKHKCGYCKQLNTNCSYGMWAECMSVEDYQNLIDRGWRRSGKYLYKPVMDITCCPLYTIRCQATNFKLTKSQKKNIKRVNRYMSESYQEKSQKNEANDDFEMRPEEMVASSMLNYKSLKKIDVLKINTEKLDFAMNTKNEDEILLNKQSNDIVNSITKGNKDNMTKVPVSSETTKDIKPGKGADPTKPPCKKAKFLRLERKQQKLTAKGISSPVQSRIKSEEKTLEEFINDVSKSPVHKLKVRLVLTSGANRDWTVIREQEYPTYRKYQMIIHNDSPDKCTEKQFTRFLLESPLEIVLKQMRVNESSYLESAALFAKYQMFIHNDPADECNLSNYKEFLVESPLQHWNPPDGPPNGYGSFHQQYWLDDKLIAVGVIDILPKCISSVYFFYDPDYRHLTLGTYGSLYELYFTRQLHNIVPNIKYYYMGFYIHTCPKMRYKANLKPSFLLCPETYMWFPVENCIAKLDKKKYSRLNEDIDAIDVEDCAEADIDKLIILVGYESCIHFKNLKSKIHGQEDYIKFAKLIGKTSLASILMVSRNSNF